MKNSYKFLFFCLLIFGTLISISTNSWFSIWMGLEINLLSFIPLMMDSNNLFSSESSLKYFLIQALASSVFLFTIIIMLMFMNFKMFYFNKIIMILLLSSLLLKSSIAPFHFWFPSVMEGLSWKSNMILMTWQKVAPLIIISYCLNFFMINLLIIFSMIFGSLGGLNQTSLRKLMAFSSINHLGWMISSMLFNEIMWLFYFLFYCLLSLTVIFLFNNFKLLYLNQTFKIFNSNLMMKIFMFIPLLSLGGLPPFLGFFPKWLIIEMMISSMMYLILFIMVMFTLITLFFYLRICYSSLLINHLSVKYNMKLNLNSKFMKMSLMTSFFSMFGLPLINLIYFFS